MARREYTEEELIKKYQSSYLRSLEKRRKVLSKARGGEANLTKRDQADLLNLELNMYKPDQVVPSIRAFIREERTAQRKRYEKALEKWDPESGDPKPKMPKQDSIIRYAEKLAKRDTRNVSILRADAILSEGAFITGEKINKRTGEVTPIKITRDQLYYLSEEELEQYVWDPIRRRRQELIEENKRKRGKGLIGKMLSEHLASMIAYEFFGSDPPERKSK